MHLSFLITAVKIHQAVQVAVSKENKMIDRDKTAEKNQAAVTQEIRVLRNKTKAGAKEIHAVGKEKLALAKGIHVVLVRLIC